MALQVIDHHTHPETPKPMLFQTLGLTPDLVHAASRCGFHEPTAVQREAIVGVLAGRDVWANAPTGSGKTAAYVLPVVQGLLTANIAAGGQYRLSRITRVLVLVPTRELAVQVAALFQALAPTGAVGPKIVTAFGGVSINPQLMRLRGGAEVVVATPGRLLDLLAHNALTLAQLTTLVLDEADRLLDAGFADEVDRILKLLPTSRQTLMFSATAPAALNERALTLLHEPLRISLQAPLSPPENAAAAAIQQRAVQVDEKRRLQLLRHLIEQGQWSRTLVFVATRYAAVHVADKLCRNGIDARSLHGDLTQGARNAVLSDFKSSQLKVLVTTDVAARGIDIPLLPVVVNFDLPRSASDYTHRIGRTGRAGHSGLAVSFITADTSGAEAHFRLIEKRQGQRVVREQIQGFEPTCIAAPLDANGGVKGLRKSKKDKLREAKASL
jgi:ATP-dependent RNA helicase RhlE